LALSRRRAIYHALKASDEVAAALQTHPRSEFARLGSFRARC